MNHMQAGGKLLPAKKLGMIMSLIRCGTVELSRRSVARALPFLQMA